MRREDYYPWAERAARWGAEYLSTLEERPVRAQTAPGEIAAMLPAAPPEEPVDMETIFADFERIVPDGMTHWQHRRFFAYFPANAAPVSMIAESLTSAMAAQCMLWQTSPAATEIETRMVDWMRQALGLPEGFQGVIQDTGTTANLCAVLTMRERALGWRGNDSGVAARSSSGSTLHRRPTRRSTRRSASPASASSISSRFRPMVRGPSIRRRSAKRSRRIARRGSYRPGSSCASGARRSAPLTGCARPSRWRASTISTSTSTPPGRVRR